jgi:predicted transcriptional regulator YdeE
MTTLQNDSFHIIGIAVRTSNNNGEAARDIGALWQRFMSDAILEKIPNKVNSSIYSVYCKYESDYTAPYTTVLGCKVSLMETIPEGMIAIEISTGQYQQFTAKGNLMEGVVYQEWGKIWNSNLDRAYTTDYELYGEKASNPADAEVNIFVALK